MPYYKCTAKTSFQTSLEEFFRYTINKKTLGKVLTKLDQPRNIPDPYSTPISEFIIRNNLRNMGATKKELIEFITGK